MNQIDDKTCLTEGGHQRSTRHTKAECSADHLQSTSTTRTVYAVRYRTLLMQSRYDSIEGAQRYVNQAEHYGRDRGDYEIVSRVETITTSEWALVEEAKPVTLVCETYDQGEVCGLPLSRRGIEGWAPGYLRCEHGHIVRMNSEKIR